MNNEQETNTHPDEAQHNEEIEKLKQVYKSSFKELRKVKAEIERIKFQLNKANKSLQNDFQKWLKVMMEQSSITNQQISKTNEDSMVKYKQLKSSIRDKKTKNNLEEFYKARD